MIAMMKEEIDIQRKIGKQLFLVNILHYENDRARKGGFSFLSRDDLAEWASMTEEEHPLFSLSQYLIYFSANLPTPAHIPAGVSYCSR